MVNTLGTISAWLLFSAYGMTAEITVYILRDSAAMKVAAIQDGKIVYIAAVRSDGTGPEVLKGEQINKIHVILNNNSGQITLTFIKCEFGISFACWSKGAPVDPGKIPVGIIRSKSSDGFFIQAKIKNISDLPDDIGELKEWDPALDPRIVPGSATSAAEDSPIP